LTAGPDISRRLLIAVEANHTRLKLADQLKESWQIVPWDPESQPIRTVRAHGPAVVLLGVRRRNPRQTLDMARSIKTDGKHPPRVALIDPHGTLTDGATSVQQGWVDGLLVGPASEDTVRQWVNQVARGEAPVIGADRPSTGVAGRIWRRLRGV